MKRKWNRRQEITNRIDEMINEVNELSSKTRTLDHLHYKMANVIREMDLLLWEYIEKD